MSEERELIDRLLSSVVLVLKSEFGPDPRMEGQTDCLLVSLEDYDDLLAAYDAFEASDSCARCDNGEDFPMGERECIRCGRS